MTDKDIAKMTLDDKKETAPAAAPFQFNFASSVPPAGGAAPAAGGGGAAPFQFNFSSGNASGPFQFKKDSDSGAELAEPEDDEDEEGADELIIKEALDALPAWSRVRVLNLLAISKVRDQLNAEYRAEVRNLIRKYEKLCEPLDAKRAAVIGGAPIAEDLSSEAKASLQKLGDEDASKPIESFWLKTLHQCSRTAALIQEQDEPVLEFLTDIRSYTLENEIGFRIEFEFRENPFFTNKVLTKTFVEDDSEESVLLKIEGTEINWNTGKNTTVKVVKKKQKGGKGGKQKRVVMTTEKCPSFFNFFNTIEIPKEEDEATLDDEELQEREEEAEMDYAVGATLRDSVVPHAISFFLGVANDEEEDGGWGFGEDDEEGDFGEEDEEDEDDDEEDHGRSHGRGGRGGSHGHAHAPAGKGGRGGGRGGQPNPAECKQQ